MTDEEKQREEENKIAAEEAAKKTQQSATNVHPANIKFVGRRKVTNKVTGKLEEVAPEAPRRINDADTVIKLPESDVQKKGFYSKHAAQIVSLFPDDYKLIVPKG